MQSRDGAKRSFPPGYHTPPSCIPLMTDSFKLVVLNLVQLAKHLEEGVFWKRTLWNIDTLNSIYKLRPLNRQKIGPSHMLHLKLCSEYHRAGDSGWLQVFLLVVTLTYLVACPVMGGLIPCSGPENTWESFGLSRGLKLQTENILFITMAFHFEFKYKQVSLFECSLKLSQASITWELLIGSMKSLVLWKCKCHFWG